MADADERMCGVDAGATSCKSGACARRCSTAPMCVSSAPTRCLLSAAGMSCHVESHADVVLTLGKLADMTGACVVGGSARCIAGSVGACAASSARPLEIGSSTSKGTAPRTCPVQSFVCSTLNAACRAAIRSCSSSKPSMPCPPSHVLPFQNSALALSLLRPLSDEQRVRPSSQDGRRLQDAQGRSDGVAGERDVGAPALMHEMRVDGLCERCLSGSCQCRDGPPNLNVNNVRVVARIS